MLIKNKALLIYGLFNLLILSNVEAQEIRGKMQNAYTAFKTLQPFLKNEKDFNNPDNALIIKENLSKLENSFHRVDEIETKYRKEAGFDSTLKLVFDILEDSNKRFKEGNNAYAFWRLRSLPLHCVTCHASHNPSLFFQDSDRSLKDLSTFDQGDFYFSTRQYSKANEAFLKALKDQDEKHSTMEILRRWLVVQTRVSVNPKEAFSILDRLLPDLKLSSYEEAEVKNWISSLKEWNKNDSKVETVSDIEALLHKSLSEDFLDNGKDEVMLLRITGLLHSLLNEKSVTDNERARALYLLGVAYQQVPRFFIYGFPEIYLELCIIEFPGTKEAKMAFKLYDEIVTSGFTGSGGTHVPSDVKLKLMDLYNKAYKTPK